MEDKYQMDGHKLKWHLDRVNSWFKGERISPLHIDLGITTGCNLACRYCYGILQGRNGYGTEQSKRFDMPKDALVQLMESAKKIGVRSIAYIGEGENTLNPALYDGLSAAKRVELDVSLATNGIRIREDKIAEMLDALSWLRINISAATPDAYSYVHQTDEKVFRRVIKNVEKLVEIKRTKGYKTTLGLQMIVAKYNFNQVVPLAKIGKELGVDYAVFKPCSDTSDKKLDSPDKEYLQMEEIFREAESLSNKDYSVIVKRTKFENLGIKDFKKCFGTQFIIAISGNGNVFPCGHWFNFGDNSFLMGNIIDKPLEEIVASEKYWEVQKKIQEINVNTDCESNCRQYYINRCLWGLSTERTIPSDIAPKPGEKKPPHINFI